QSVALITTERNLDSAVFANYYLYPIPARIFVGRDNYRNSAPDPKLPKTIVAINAAGAERVGYEVLRDRELRAGHCVVMKPQLGEPAVSFTLPIAASLDGPSPETFVVEATLVNPANPLPSNG